MQGASNSPDAQNNLPPGCRQAAEAAERAHTLELGPC